MLRNGRDGKKVPDTAIQNETPQREPFKYEITGNHATYNGHSAIDIPIIEHYDRISM